LEMVVAGNTPRASHSPKPARCSQQGIKVKERKKSKVRALTVCPLKHIVTSTFEHIKLPAKLLDYFLQSNKSNINQSVQAAKG